MATKITANFSLDEIQHSETAARKNIENIVPIDAYGVMKDLFKNVLQPLRDFVGPIKINSGYRCLELNEVIGGSARSQHMYSAKLGAACDFVHYKGDINTVNLINTILKLKLPYDQMILEYPDTYSGGWVHVSVSGYQNENREEILVKERNKPYVKIDPKKENTWGIVI